MFLESKNIHFPQKNVKCQHYYLAAYFNHMLIPTDICMLQKLYRYFSRTFLLLPYTNCAKWPLFDLDILCHTIKFEWSGVEFYCHASSIFWACCTYYSSLACTAYRHTVKHIRYTACIYGAPYINALGTKTNVVLYNHRWSTIFKVTYKCPWGSAEFS